MRMSRYLGVLVILPFVVATTWVDAHSARGDDDAKSTNATYFNDASVPGADPFVLYDQESGYYYAYSTEGADSGHQFAIYRSPDLATWEHLPGGALNMADGTQWGHDWFWAPEVYHNAATGQYFLFYSARMNDNVAEHFRYADFEEPSKIGVAVADSPQGPFRNITNGPLDYFPYDPDYHDVNLIMDATQKKPPETLQEGMTAPKGTYLPYIDPNLLFDDGRIYLYFSRNAYRNWVWDRDLGKYVEESNIYAVELTSDWWNDPDGATMPTVEPRYVNTHRAPDDPPEVRKDGFTPILNYGADKQSWENAHVNDYAETHGEKKDRRWEEGSTAIRKHNADGRPIYYLTYSANNFENEFYGVGYAVADNPLGPWRKSQRNPVLQQNEQLRMYSTGHGSVVAGPDASQLYYVHHGRPSTETNRRLYTERMHVSPGEGLTIDQSTGDEPMPSGVAPYSLTPGADLIELRHGEAEIGWTVSSAAGAAMDLFHPLNRVAATADPAGAVQVDVRGDHATLNGAPDGVAALSLRYQRKKANGDYFDIRNTTDDASRGAVAATIPVAECTRTITGVHTVPLEVRDGVTCVKDATVSGPIRVARGASLVAVGSTVLGSVQAKDARSVWLSGGSVSGSVTITGTSGIVRIDDMTVTGPVDVAESTAGLTIENSELHAPVSVIGNVGSRPITVAGNKMSAALSCTGNVPAPTNAGRPNTIEGPARGQCQGL